MMPSCDQTGVPIHFHSSTTSGSASLMSLRILPRVFPRQSPSSAILFEMRSDADFFMFSPLALNSIELDVETNSNLRHDLMFDRRLDHTATLGGQRYLFD